MTNHPNLAELQRFICGQLDDERLEQIATHLEQCAECVTCLDSVSDDDPLSKELQRCGPLPEDLSAKLRGKQIGGYHLLDELGRGGMGIVYRAYDARLKRNVALKIIPAGQYADPEQRLRLRQEAETTAALRHAGIVQIYDIGEQDEIMYIALELLHPRGLAVFSGQHNPRWCAAVIKQVAETLHYAHQAGFVHRDIKPENILLAPSNDNMHPWAELENIDEHQLPQLKITDFGLSKNLDEDSHLTRAGMMLGTPDYMAPEQIPDSDEPVGIAVDIYALGAVLYELLSGQHALHAGSISEQIKILRDDDPIPLRRLNAHIPKDLETICLKCLRKKPQQRYVSAQALAEDLSLFLRGEPILAQPLCVWQKLLCWARRTPILASHFATIILLYLLHLFAMWGLQEPAHMGAGHFHISVFMLVWFILVLLIHRVYRQLRRDDLSEYLYVALPMLLVQIENIINIGPAYFIPNFLLLAIIASALIRPHPRMVWFAVLMAQLAFLIFAITSNLMDRLLYSTERILFFSVLIVMTGVAVHLLLRRMQAVEVGRKG